LSQQKGKRINFLSFISGANSVRILKIQPMKRIIVTVALVVNIACIKAQDYSDSISVNFFLIDECRISQNMTSEINYVSDHFNQEQLNYNCYFPSTSSTEEKIEVFKEDYGIAIPCFSDYDKRNANFYGATIAPEVVVYDEKNQQLLYRGRINNSFASVGVRRRVVTSYDLRTALESILNQKEIKIKETQAIGCYINH
jgi:hypothetical protein